MLFEVRFAYYSNKLLLKHGQRKYAAKMQKKLCNKSEEKDRKYSRCYIMVRWNARPNYGLNICRAINGANVQTIVVYQI
jgi:hypothetical protein